MVKFVWICDESIYVLLPIAINAQILFVLCYWSKWNLFVKHMNLLYSS
jgi:hypothetical protein